MDSQIYCNDVIKYSRFKTREVKVGKIGIGGSNPIRVQSMTTTDTMDTQATVEQSIRIIEAGGELVRITAPSLNEAKNLENIKNELRARGYDTALCADIHFTPNAAEHAAKIVEKVRVNPGNYADKKKFEEIEYTDESYQAELERIRKRFTPLVEICKERGTAMRIGTNHGSLSDRILSRYGDTPKGMVESAMEFVKICEDLGYREIILSMKASNTQVMVQAYRLLVNEMITTGRDYPLHLGVTEAGEGEDGRIKSAVGIGTLLEDGLGDTVRVSLTEEPEVEIPVAQELVAPYAEKVDKRQEVNQKQINLSYSPFEYKRQTKSKVGNIGGDQVPRVIADFSNAETIKASTLFSVGYIYNEADDKWTIRDTACDFIYVGSQAIDFEIPGTLGVIQDYESWSKSTEKDRHHPLLSLSEFIKQSRDGLNSICFVKLNKEDLSGEDLLHLKKREDVILIYHSDGPGSRAELELLKEKEIDAPLVLGYTSKIEIDSTFQLHASVGIGQFLIDGNGDGVWLSNPSIDRSVVNATAFGVLQATRTRISKTEYISCPSCGRTLFDLQETTAKIRSKTDHLKGVKIGIMGCIVNGPGEMADADYGYVGTGVGKITLYKEKEVVKRNIPSEEAVNELIELIKDGGDWRDPSS